MSDSFAQRAVATGYQQTTPTLVLGGIASALAVTNSVSSIASGYDTEFQRGDSPTRGRPALYWLTLVPASLATATQAIRLADHLGSRDTEADVAQARQDIPIGELARLTFASAVGLYLRSRTLASGRGGRKRQFRLSRLGYASTAVSAALAAYSLYENGKELLSRPETQMLILELGLVAEALRRRVVAQFKKLRPSAEALENLVAELRVDLTPDERRLLADRLTPEDINELRPLADFLENFIDEVYPELTPEQRQMIVESMRDGQKGQ